VNDADPTPEAARLMADITAGREAALARLILLIGRPLTLFATRILGNAADGEEVAQDTFLRVWRMAAQYDPARGQPLPWIYRIAVNLCIDRQRRNRFWRLFKRVDAADLADVLAGDAPSAVDTLAARQRLLQVQAGIAALPERQRMAIMLSAVAGLDGAGIAAALGTTTGATEQLLVRARRGLRRHLGEDEGEDR
jgi:RNA polymerase sigma-70 factor (ECF subfamily)